MNVRDDVLSFLEAPLRFAATAQDPEIWLQGLRDFAIPQITQLADRTLRPAQVRAWEGLAEQRVGLILGPPGTGKTHLLSWLITGYAAARRAVGRPARTFVTAFTRNAAGNVLDGVAKRQALHRPGAPAPIYYGAAPDAGLVDGVQALRRGEEAALREALDSGEVVVGGTIWSLYRLLQSGGALAEPLFDLVCIDEASQMVLGQSLMALAGLAPGGRVVVAGDDQQLPPVRAARSTKIEGREMGGSLYAFLKSAQVAEFPLEETFRLNKPLAEFPERRFYPGHYVSAAPAARLALRPDWAEGLDLVTRAALDPAFPVVVVVHDAPAASTRNAFEAQVAARVVTALADRLAGAGGEPPAPQAFWNEHVAVVSPHRAQNAEIRNSLPEELRRDAFVETVDRIQGKERDAVVLSYCVSDAEFALAEAEFIFASERLNVAITRARTKLVMLISRNLLDAIPAEQEVMDKAEILREFVFSCPVQTETAVDGPGGRQVNLQIRARGFDGDDAVLDVTPDVVVAVPAPEMTPALQGVLDAIRHVVSRGAYATAALFEVRRALGWPGDLFAEGRALHHLGWVSLSQRRPRNGGDPFWVAQPFEAPRRIYPVDLESVRSRIEVVVREAKSGRHAFYNRVRDRFAWMNPHGGDDLLPVLQVLAAEGVLTLPTLEGGDLTVALVGSERPAAPPAVEPEISLEDFRTLNALEDLEAQRINFGIYDAWTSAVALARTRRVSLEAMTAALGRLAAGGHLMIADEGRVRSRMAELARELRYVKQRFRSDDADRRPYLVRNLKVEVRDRRKPRPNPSVREVFEAAAADASPAQATALAGLGQALRARWGENAALADFQARGLLQGLAAWRGEVSATLAIAADTGSGKTEAAVLPMIAAALGDRLSGVQGVRAVLAYPRIRLAANQAQRLAAYLAECQQVEGLPVLTLGLQIGDVPDTFEGMAQWYRPVWADQGGGAFAFPFFACPKCGGALRLQAGAGADGADALICGTGDWRFDGWIGSKAQLQARPPALFLPTTDSLHQWLHDTRYGRLFGDDPGYAPPRALLADEIHLYTHIHGAQVGATLRRLSARAQLNAPEAPPMVAVGMSATIGEPGAAWGRLIGRDEATVITPLEVECDPNPRGREYFYFVQPEVESRGADIAGASTTIQSLMCLAHGMRRRTGAAGGYRSLVFFDSIDRMRRLHGAYIDAEEARELAAFRTRAYGDDAFGQPQTECCGDPVGCSRFVDGECWWFAATDTGQWGAGGARRPGDPLRVARAPVKSGQEKAEELVKSSDIVFATSALEVGYDDPDMALVYQHYAPQNLASFVQRKGRGGRGADDRPVTAVTLSLYSPRDTWWFRRPHEMVAPQGFETPINPDNPFVRRGQALSAMLDGLARVRRRGDETWPVETPSSDALRQAGDLVEQVYGTEVWAQFGVAEPAAFWDAAQGARDPTPVRWFSDHADRLTWAPKALFDTINLPALSVAGPETFGGEREDIGFALSTVAPGNATRRYNPTTVHWRPPADGRAPWLADDDYAVAERTPLRSDVTALLRALPLEVRGDLGDLSLDLCRPTRVTLEKLGWMAGALWTPEVGYAANREPPLAPFGDDALPVAHNSVSSLRGFLLIEADAGSARPLDLGPLAGRVSAVAAHAGEGVADAPAGLTATQVAWGADAEIHFDAPGVEPIGWTQTFTDPATGQALLHGYALETEGLRFAFDSARLDAFVAERLAAFEADPGDAAWRRSQFTRYLVETGARAAGVGAFDARRAADLIAGLEGDPELRGDLTRVLKFWDKDRLVALFEAARVRRFGQHPLLTPARVESAALALGRPEGRAVLQGVREALKDPAAMAGYLRTSLLHGSALRLRRLVAHVGQAEDRRLLAHARLPLQFGADAEDVVTLCEAGSGGDGTIRTVISRWTALQEHWAGGFLSACPNAAEDAVVAAFWATRERHDVWRGLDPRNARALQEVAAALAPADGPVEPLPGPLVRTLFHSEAVGGEVFQLYDLASELHAVKVAAEQAAGRAVTDWELASAAVAAATEGTAPTLARLHAAYGGLEDVGAESLSADARLADQAYRLAAPLCIDGCRGCVHQSSDLMSGSLTEATVSRRLLVCYGV